jgi:hypothetical protein
MGSTLSNLASNTTALQIAFVVALLLLIMSHKISVEGMVSA